MNRVTEDVKTESGIIDPTKSLVGIDEFQKVIAVGPNVRDIKVGDLVSINPTRFGKRVHKEGSIQQATVNDNPVTEYIFPTIMVNGQECLFLQDRDINYVVDSWQVIEDKKTIKKIPMIVGNPTKLKS
jgi:threonine dehydrogenase-like Zn-dependent dehydrogenase